MDLAQQEFERLFGPEFGHGKAFDLANLRRALDALGAPHQNLAPAIHVAGTNGKGSTIAFMRAMAEAAGLRVHAFTKPHLFTLNERFLVAGAPAETEHLIDAARRVAEASGNLTQFDAQVAAAFLLFSECPGDLCLIETGMGGRDDSTNVITAPRACVLTPIDLDHQDALGMTLGEIAAHKAGILKRGAPAIVARQVHEAAVIIEAEARRADAPLLRQGIEWDAFVQNGRLVVQTESRLFDLEPPALAGPHQIDNAGLATVALLAASVAPLDDAHISAGLSAAHWPGRLQPITSGPLSGLARGAELWIDGGHNPHAARALRAALQAMNRRREAKTALVIGMRARKNWRAFIDELAASADFLAAIPVADEGVTPEALSDHARRTGADAFEARDVRDAIKRAAERGAHRIVVCGSLLAAAEALNAATPFR